MATTPKKKPGRPRKATPKPTDIVKYNARSSSRSSAGGWMKYVIIAGVVAIIVGGVVFKDQIFGGGSLTNISFSEVGNSAPINTLKQTKQTIMVMPSDQLLQEMGSLTTSQSMGKTLYHRDYRHFFLSNSTNQQIISTIQRQFIDAGYPLVDLEQTLKSLENQGLLDAADGVTKDAKTLLLTTARPDVIVELYYKNGINTQSRNASRQLDYNIMVKDAFSSKTIATINESNVKMNSEYGATSTLQTAIKSELPALSNQIKKYFKDILTNGREITFTISTASGSAIALHDIYNQEGETYADWVRSWVVKNAKRGAANMQRNTNNEMYFVDVRIKNVNDDGTQYNAYDFADDFRKEFYRTFNIQISNSTQGLAGAQLLIK